jgi:hypothetical protein
MDALGFMLGQLVRLDLSGQGPPWPLQLWRDDSRTWEYIAAPDPDLTTPRAPRIYAPLATGELPGPDLVADGYGQCIMVPIG